MKIELTFTESDGTVISRAESGKICFIEHSKIRKPVKAGETWECEIVEEKPTLLIVKPVTKLLTVAQNAQIFQEKALQLKKQFQC